MLFCVSKPVFSIPFLPQQPCKVFSHWLIIYTRLYRLQHSPNLVDVGIARVSEFGTLQVPWNSMEFHGTARVSEIGAL